MKFTKPRFQSTNLAKTFDSFEDAYTNILKHVPELKSYCGDTALDSAVLHNIMNTIIKNIPSISNKNYPNTLSFSINAKEVGFKTDSNIAFGWRTVFDRKDASIKYKFRITFINASTYQQEIISSMIDDKWFTVTPKHQSRFWNDIEGKKPVFDEEDTIEKEQ